ncbi:hypothetical protein C3747_755g9 [Trypanosoma cruzi]|uniref:Uncharacterized protein n=1 Tax=Trypanosoma cruzi TaxID=5693 RepID=A0A2V2UJC0_TRYCR|nr:hypothetical protein C3747_755g9 [Trypanosoma cruzi]
MVARICVLLAGDVRAAMDTIVKNYEKCFFPVLCEKQPTPELEAMPSYLPDTVVLQLYRDVGEAEFADYMDANSLAFVALEMPNGPLCVALMPLRSYTTKGPNEHWCRQQELSPAFAAVFCVFPSACQNSVSCCAERTTRKKTTATIASLVLPRRFYWLTPFRMPCGRRNRSIVSP